jgi:hypothetical protein
MYFVSNILSRFFLRVWEAYSYPIYKIIITFTFPFVFNGKLLKNNYQINFLASTSFKYDVEGF